MLWEGHKRTGMGARTLVIAIILNHQQFKLVLFICKKVAHQRKFQPFIGPLKLHLKKITLKKIEKIFNKKYLKIKLLKVALTWLTLSHIIIAFFSIKKI